MDPNSPKEPPPSDITSSSQLSTSPSSSPALPSEDISMAMPITTVATGSSLAVSQDAGDRSKVSASEADGGGQQPSSPVFDARKESSHYQLVYGLGDTNTSSETSLSESPKLSGVGDSDGGSRPPAAPASIEQARLEASVSQPPLPESDLSATSDGVVRTHASLSASNSGSPPLSSSSSHQPDGKAEEEESNQQLNFPDNQSDVPSESIPHERDRNDAEGVESGKGSHDCSSTCKDTSAHIETLPREDFGESQKLNSECQPDGGPVSQPHVSPTDSSLSADQVIHVDDISLHSRSTSPLEEAKVHPLSVLTSDSEAEEDPVRARRHSKPTYSRITSTSGEPSAVPHSGMRTLHL